MLLKRYKNRPSLYITIFGRPYLYKDVWIEMTNYLTFTK